MNPTIESTCSTSHQWRSIGRRLATALVFVTLAAAMPLAVTAQSWTIDRPCPKGTYQPPKCGLVEVLEAPECTQNSECPSDGYSCQRIWHENASRYQYRCARPHPPRFENYVANPGQTDSKGVPLAIGADFRSIGLVNVFSVKSVYEGELFMFAAFPCESGRRTIAQLKPRSSLRTTGDRLRAIVVAPDEEGRPTTVATADAAGNGQAVSLSFVCGRTGTHLVGASQIGGGSGRMVSFNVRVDEDSAAP